MDERSQVGGAGRRALWVGLLVALAGAWAAFAIEARGRRELARRYAALAQMSAKRMAELEALRAVEQSGGALPGARSAPDSARVLAAALALEALRPERARELLDEVEETRRGFEWGALALAAELAAPALHAHESELSALALSPDGAWLASGDEEGLLLLGPSAPGGEVRALALGEDALHGIAFSPSGALLAAATAEGFVHVLAREPLEERALLAGHTEGVLALAFAGEELLVSAGEDGTLRVWSLAQERELVALAPFEGLPVALATHAASARFAAASDEGELGLFGLDGAELLALEVEGERWSTLAFAHGGGRVAAGGARGVLAVFDAASGAKLRELGGAAEPITGAWLDEHGRLALASSMDGGIALHDVDAGILLARFDGGIQGVERMSACALGARVAFFAPLAERARVWARPPPRGSRVLELSSSTATAIASDARGETWYAGRADGSVQRIEAQAGVVGAERVLFDSAVGALALAPDATVLAAGDARGALVLLDARTLEELRALEGHEHEILDLGFASDGAKLASATSTGELGLWSAASGERLRAKPGPQQWVHASALAADGRLGLWIAGGGLVRAYELESGARAGGFRDAWLGLVSALAPAPDGKRAALCTGQNRLRVFDLEGGRLVAEAAPRPDLVSALAASPDGRLFAAGGFDGSLRLFDFDAAVELLRLPGRGGTVGRLRFTPDGRRLCAALHGGALEVWESDLAAWVEGREPRATSR